MSLVTPLLLLLTAQQQTSDKVFQSPTLGLSLSHAPTWAFKRKKHSSEFTIPIQDGKSQFRVEIFEAEYRGTIPRWQEIEAMLVSSTKKTLIKQWQEEYLGVPMLLTSSSYTDKNGYELSMQSGLLYTKGPTKFQYRLESPSGVFDEAQQIWKEALLSLRTTDGRVPEVEDPESVVPDVESKKKPKKDRLDPVGKPDTRPSDAVVKPTKTERITADDFDRGKIVLGPQSQKVTVGGKEGELRFAAGWTLKPVEGTGFILTHPKVPIKLTLEAAGVLDAPQPDRALLGLANQTLDLFKTVSSRLDTNPRWTRAGQKLITVKREGVDSAGKAITVVHAVGYLGDYYWAGTLVGTPDEFKAGQTVINDLFETMAVTVKS